MAPQNETQEVVQTDEEVQCKNQHDNIDEENKLLTRKNVWDLVFCLLAWGFTVSNVTMG